MCRKLVFFIFAVLFSVTPLLLANQLMAMPKSAAPLNIPTISGTVIETMNASGYTYMLVESGATKTWVAIPATPVEKGAAIEYYKGMVKKNFTSKTLDRTFDTVVFSSGLAGQKTETAPQPVIEKENDSFSAAVKAEKTDTKIAPAMEMSGGSLGAIAPLEDISIEKAAAANGYTVEKIFTDAKELAGKKIQVHGKVVKFNPLIMGKNWIHLQDGTGNPMQNSHDLVVTSSETVEVGSIVTIEGVLAANKDFGAGYKYAAIVEDAAIIK
ncbi:DNA-binding protein [Desulfopila sp. IMCC35006]|uniref:DNA-binding protein n=1 Tax=Desulfopila sp. IMCC35006 TaxID=2569542 RepID=UPI0010ABB482|nr:DNA-binding protein [Desulfopila sp. IMCC35006]TKB23777.1 DNA-binding protein [Desulfopila sp. IMCC35006]